MNHRKMPVLAAAVLLVIGAAIWFIGSQKEYEEKHLITLNEVCSNNFSLIQDEAGNYPDYVEIYNAGEEDKTLTGWKLCRIRKKTVKFALDQVTVPAKGYAVIWLTEEEKDDGYHAPFTLDREGDTLALADERNTKISVVQIPYLDYDTTYSCAEDGTGQWQVMTCSAGLSNSNAQYIDRKITLNQPILSENSGFYEEDFTLHITAAPGEKIYYTLDGSIPDTDSRLYSAEEGIVITDVSREENVLSDYEDLTWSDMYRPEEPVDKARIVRAVAYDDSADVYSPVVTGTYFVGYENRDEYKGYKVISIVTDPANLIDSEKGIYTAGDAYQEYIRAGHFENLPKDEIPSSYVDENGNIVWRYESYNANKRGRTTERPADIAFFNEDHALYFTQSSGIRIAGESSRGSLKKSLNLFARKAYDGNDEFLGSFFGINQTKLRLRNTDMAHPIWRESFLQHLASGRISDTQDSTPCAVFLDGEYWGLYLLTELYDSSYFQYRYGLDENHIWLVKNNSAELGGDEALSEYHSLLSSLKEMDLSADSAYDAISAFFDEQNLIEYYCTLLYFNSKDITGTHNQMLWKVANEYAEGDNRRWRYMLYDLDDACGEPSDNTIELYRSIDDELYLPGYLCANERFKKQYCLTMMDLANVDYAPDTVEPLLNQWSEQYEQQTIKDRNRYQETAYTKADYDAEVSAIADFFERRRSYMEEYLREDLNLTGEIVSLEINNTMPEGGTVHVNSAELPEKTEWSGEYFTDYPVTVTAETKPGYVFKGWRGDLESSEQQLTLDLPSTGLQLEAVFEKTN